MQAVTTSRRLWGGMSVAMPTAIPVVPFSNRLGTRAGSSTGSSSVPSKFGDHSTVPWPSSDSSSAAYFVRRDSVYRIAANDFGSSGEPKLPCPSTSGYRYEKGCAINTMAS